MDCKDLLKGKPTNRRSCFISPSPEVCGLHFLMFSAVLNGPREIRGSEHKHNFSFYHKSVATWTAGRDALGRYLRAAAPTTNDLCEQSATRPS